MDWAAYYRDEKAVMATMRYRAREGKWWSEGRANASWRSLKGVLLQPRRRPTSFYSLQGLTSNCCRCENPSQQLNHEHYRPNPNHPLLFFSVDLSSAPLTIDVSAGAAALTGASVLWPG